MNFSAPSVLQRQPNLRSRPYFRVMCSRHGAVRPGKGPHDIGAPDKVLCRIVLEGNREDAQRWRADGRRSASGARPARSGAIPQRWSTSSCESGRIPSRASAPASAGCGWPRPMAASGLKQLVAERSKIGASSYSSVNSILKNNIDRRRPVTPADGPAIVHDNIRGPTSRLRQDERSPQPYR